MCSTGASGLDLIEAGGGGGGGRGAPYNDL